MAETRARKRAPRKTTGGAKPRTVSDDHKAAMAEGRAQGHAIRRYLTALKAARGPKTRGRKRTPESIQQRIDRINAALAEVDLDPLAEVQYLQERRDLTTELTAMTAPVDDPEQYAEAAVKALKPYSERKGITYASWRELGVPAVVLKKAGIR